MAEKENGKAETYTEKQRRYQRDDMRRLARRVADGLEYHDDEELDELARQATDSFLDDPDGPFQEIEDDKKRRFLRAYSVTGVITRAARLANIDRTSPYREGWNDDEQFQKALEVAKLAAADSLISEAWRRGVEGVEKPTGWYMGEPGGVVREYSDKLLVKLLHASAKGDLFRDRVDVRSSNINFNIEDLDRLPAPVLAAVAKGTSLAVALTEHVERLSEARRAQQLPAGRDVSQTEDNDDNP